MMTVSVSCAFLARGSPNAMTPLDTASTPVMAAQPLENAFMMSQMNAKPTKWPVAGLGAGMAASGVGMTACGEGLYSPDDDQDDERPDEKEGRQDEGCSGVLYAAQVHHRASMARMIRQSGRVYGIRLDSTEVTAVTPAEMPTAAVRM